MKIGQLATLTGCSIQSIRFYEKEQLLSAPRRSDGNYRLYDQKNLEQLTFIKRCRNLDIRLAEIKQLLHLKQSPETQCEEVNDLIDGHIIQIDLRMHELKKLKASLTNDTIEISVVKVSKVTNDFNYLKNLFKV